MSTFEELALMEFISSRPYGNILREIAERALCDIHSRSHLVFPPEQKQGQNSPCKCINVIDGHYYKSIKQAALLAGYPYGKVKWDIETRKFEYNIIPVKFL